MIEQTPAILLARVQFAFTISFHFLLPAFSIGLASYLAVLEALWLRTGSGVYANLFRYWLKIFAIVFAMGVVSGIVMSYQFGTNRSEEHTSEIQSLMRISYAVLCLKTKKNNQYIFISNMSVRSFIHNPNIRIMTATDRCNTND